MVSKVKRARELFSGVSARDVAIVGGVAGAVGIGAYAVYTFSGQSTIDKYISEYRTIADDYLAELDQFVKQNGTGSLTPTQKAALDYKKGLLDNIQKSIDALAAGQLAVYQKAVEDLFIVVALAIGLKYGPAAVSGFINAVKSRGTPKTTQGYVQVFEGSQAVGLVAEGSVSLATAFYNTTMVGDSAVAAIDLAFESATINAEIGSLTGAALIIAQTELAAIASDLALLPEILAAVPPLL